MRNMSLKLAPATALEQAKKSYTENFPPLPALSCSSHDLKNTHDPRGRVIERELMRIINGSSCHVKLERPPCPSPTDIKNKVVGAITGTGWNPPISRIDRAEWKDAYNAYKLANVKFDTEGELGEYPPLMIYPPVHCPPVHHSHNTLLYTQ